MVIEVPRFALAKRAGDGRVEFVSPVPCPFNYGSVAGSTAADGDPVDAVVLGPRLARGTRVHSLKVVGVVRFEDDGCADDKLVCSSSSVLRVDQALAVRGFFRVYALAKRGMAAFRRSGPTRYTGLEVERPGH